MGGPTDSEQRRAIRVLVRIRQPTIDHLGASILSSECCRALDQKTLRLQNPRKNGSVDATYHSVFAPGAPQSAVHDTVGQVVDDAIAGVNSCIMAYGATGTGKTHTMMGPPHIFAASSAGLGLILEDHGLIPRLLSDLFQRKPGTASVTISYVEIYNESIIDLLEETTDRRHRSKVTVWEDAHGVTHMRHLRKVVVSSLGEAIQILCLGAQQRSTRHTALNQHSSRGHTILQLHVENRPAPDAPHVIHSKINLVDLAGSEPHPGGPVRANSHATETKSINVSLSALIGVVCTLARGKSRTHVPYRDSKLTTILKDSLGGNCSTWVIISLSAAPSAYQETHSSLQFANRAAAVTNTVTVNECDDVEGVIAAKDEEIRRLRSMIQQLTDSGVASKLAAPSKEHLYDKITGLKVTPAPASTNRKWLKNATLLQQELRAEKLRVQQLEARRESAAIGSRSSVMSVAAQVVEERFSTASGWLEAQGPYRTLTQPSRLSQMQLGQRMLSPYKSTMQRPASSSSRPSTGSKKAVGKSELPFTVSRKHRRVYSDALQQKAVLSNARVSRQSKRQQAPQTLKDLGQQLIREQQKRMSGLRSGPESFIQFGFNAEKKLLSLAAAGGDTTHLEQLLARYKVLSKELAITKLSALQPDRLNVGTRLSTARSLEVAHQEPNLSYRRFGSSASWPVAALQEPSAASSPTSSGRGFGLSSVISMPRPDALETNQAAPQEEEVHRTGSDPAQQPERRAFGLSALLRGESKVSNQTGSVPASHIHPEAVT